MAVEESEEDGATVSSLWRGRQEAEEDGSGHLLSLLWRRRSGFLREAVASGLREA